MQTNSVEALAEWFDYAQALKRTQAYEAIIRDAMEAAPQMGVGPACDSENRFMDSEDDIPLPCFGRYPDGMAVFYVGREASGETHTRRFIIHKNGPVIYTSCQVGICGLSVRSHIFGIEDIAYDKEARHELSRVAGWFKAMKSSGWDMVPSNVETLVQLKQK